MLQTLKFPAVVIGLQVLFIILFGIFVRYPKLGLPIDSGAESNETAAAAQHGDAAHAEVGQYYPFFQDVHVMIFIGFGFLMTFLKRYGFGSVGLNMLVAALVLQWATLTGGWIHHFKDGVIRVGIVELIEAEFAAAAVLISFGAVLGKVSAVQLLLMAFIEVVLFQVNEHVVFGLLKATDVGDSMVVHAFGAYFGLTVARLVYNADVDKAEAKESSVYHSDLFAMIGTIFLWLFWPSFNSVVAVGEGQYRAVINTYFSLAACAVVTFAISAACHKGKLNMVHIQNATLAGGVAVGTMADLIIQPWAALLIGSLAAVLSVIGYRFITPFLSRRLGIHDTCGVHNLHGMPGVFSGLGGIICAAIATTEVYGSTLVNPFPARKGTDGITAGQQAGRQAAGLAVSLGIAIVGGLLTGLLLRLPIWDQPKGIQVFDDTSYWIVPDDGFPSTEEEAQENENQHLAVEMESKDQSQNP